MGNFLTKWFQNLKEHIFSNSSSSGYHRLVSEPRAKTEDENCDSLLDVRLPEPLLQDPSSPDYLRNCQLQFEKEYLSTYRQQVIVNYADVVAGDL